MYIFRTFSVFCTADSINFGVATTVSFISSRVDTVSLVSSLAPVSVSLTKSAMLSLLQFVKDKQICFRDKVTKDKVVWKDISLLVQPELPGVTPRQCDQKWRNLQQQ